MPSANSTSQPQKKKKLREAFLIALRGPCRGRVFVLGHGTTTLGRDKENPIVLPDVKVSRRHAAIHLDETGATIIDMQSRNGIRVNDKQVTEAALGSGARVQVGLSVFRFQTDDTDICLEPDVPDALYDQPEPETAVLDKKRRLDQLRTKPDTKAEALMAQPAPPPGRAKPAAPVSPSAKPAEKPKAEPGQFESGLFRKVLSEEAKRIDEEYGRSGIAVPAGGLQVTCVSGPDQGKSCAIVKSGIVLGAGPDVTLTLSAPGADPQQARLVPITDERIRLTNLGALNALRVDGVAVRTMELEVGLQFEICGSQFLVHL